MRKTLFCLLCCALTSLSAADVAVFPVQGVNLDRSFADAFGALLANKYEKISGQRTIPPARAGKAIGADSNLIAAAKSLGANEYLEVTGVGLYLSRKEYREVDSGSNKVIIIRETSNRVDDQQLLDNSKTVVTVSRVDVNGAIVHRAEMTLLTYGDIEESTERFALALHRKLSVEEVRTTGNITRKEGIASNRTFVESRKGIKMGGYYVAGGEAEYSPLASVGFNYKGEAEKFFLEFGVGGLIPGTLFEENTVSIGGNYFEIGASYFVLNGVASVYAGGGLMPYFNWMTGLRLGAAPYLQMGILMPRTSSTCFYFDVRVAQNVFPLVTETYDYSINTYGGYRKTRDYPTMIGLEFGIGW